MKLLLKMELNGNQLIKKITNPLNQMRKMNPTMVTISWIFTILFALLLIYSWGNASKIQTPYGSMATSLPYILGLISFCGVIPGILWIITYLTAHKIDSQSNSQNKYNAIPTISRQ